MDLHIDLASFGGFKPRLRNGEGLGTRVQVEKAAGPAAAGGCHLRDICALVLQSDRRTQHGCSGAIADGSSRGAIASLRLDERASRSTIKSETQQRRAQHAELNGHTRISGAAR